MKPANCTVCGKTMKPREGKIYCGSSCRVKGHYSKDMLKMEYSKLQDLMHKYNRIFELCKKYVPKHEGIEKLEKKCREIADAIVARA